MELVWSLLTFLFFTGILMIVAWMMFCSIGIVCPRFYKPAWPEDTQLCGQKVWFSVIN